MGEKRNQYSLEQLVLQILMLASAAATLIFGFLGYGDKRYNLNGTERFYYSILLLFAGPINEDSNSFIYIAWYCGIIFAGSVWMTLLFHLFASIRRLLINAWGDSVVVFGNTRFSEEFISNNSHTYLSSINSSTKKFGISERTARHILLMFNNDFDNLEFYHNHQKELSRKNVYIMLNSIDTTLIKRELPQVHFFSYPKMVARNFWREYPLYHDLYVKQKKKPVDYKIAIIGFSFMGEAIFDYGFTMNLIPNQPTIDYHLWDCRGTQYSEYCNMDTMNNDKIIIHRENWIKNLALLKDMNRIIICADDRHFEILQTLVFNRSKDNQSQKIFVYSPRKVDLSFLLPSYLSQNVFTFGAYSDVLTYDNVIREKTLFLAKLFNYDYSITYTKLYQKPSNKNGKLSINDKKNMEAAWNHLDRFTMESNISQADYYEIRQRIGFDDPELEHIRWCRFSFVNHWKTCNKDDVNNFYFIDDVHEVNSSQEKASKTKKIKEYRLHALLIPFNQLTEEDQNKDSISNAVIQGVIDEIIKEQNG